jgi:hypothetical protein
MKENCLENRDTGRWRKGKTKAQVWKEPGFPSARCANFSLCENFPLFNIIVILRSDFIMVCETPGTIHPLPSLSLSLSLALTSPFYLRIKNLLE